jgi:hypothetical protein
VVVVVAEQARAQVFPLILPLFRTVQQQRVGLFPLLPLLLELLMLQLLLCDGCSGFVHPPWGCDHASPNP